MLCARKRLAKLARHCPAFGEGVFGGLAACTKLNAVAGFVVVLAILVATPYRPPLVRRLSLVGFSILGAIFPFAAFALLFRAGGAFHEFVDAYFFFNSIRGGLGLPPAEWLRLPLQIRWSTNQTTCAAILHGQSVIHSRHATAWRKRACIQSGAILLLQSLRS